MKNWTLERHRERAKWSGEERAKFYLAEKRDARFQRSLSRAVGIIALTVVMICAGSAWLALGG